MGARIGTSPAQTQAALQAERQRQQRAERLAALRSLDSLHDVPDAELDRLVDLGTFRAFPSHETVFQEREPGTFLYLLFYGSVRLTASARDGNEVLLDVLDRGDCFGEGLLFGEYFQRVTAYTETPCLALQLPLDRVRLLFGSSEQLHATLRRIHSRRLIVATLARVPLFSHLTPVERLTLTSLLKVKQFPRHCVVLNEGYPGEAFYLIETGQVVIERNGQTIASMGEGDFFGEMSLLTEKPHNATVRTVTPADVLMMAAADFHAMLGDTPDMEERLRAAAMQRRATVEKFDQDRSRQLTMAVQHGLLRGQYLLVRRPELCPPGCRLCEQACHARHGNTRLHLNGVTVGNYDVVDTCRQCEIGAECVEACPENAFLWNDKGALSITDACTGCGACVPACPYTAIDRVPRNANIANSPLWHMLGAVQRMQRTLQPVIPLQAVPYSHRADKCDFCADHDDMACLSECPTGALRLVTVEELLPL